MTTGDEAPTYLSTTTQDGVRLSIRHYARPTATHVPVLMTHGMFSNAGICAGLAGYLRARGHNVYVFEWRGHGASGIASEAADYEQVALRDFAAAVDRVVQHSGHGQIGFVGHSAGGVLPWMYLARRPADAARFRGVVSLASQTTHAGRSPRVLLKMAAGYAVVALARRAPARLFRLGPSDESAAVLKQWMRWNLRGRWVGAEGFDYCEQLAAVSVPALVFSGAGDLEIAPQAGCAQLFHRLGSKDKTLVHCAKTLGFREDYSHARIIASRNAQLDVWPQIGDWLAARSRLDAPESVRRAS